MGSLPFIKSNKIALFSLVLISMLTTSVLCAYQFQVGGKNGWIKPSSNDTESYNDWATRHRFHIGDTLYFQYQNDTLLVVNSTDYENCYSFDPIAKYEDGNTGFQFDRHGYFYFISGQPDHCLAGQKMVVRVMVQSRIESSISRSPAYAPRAYGPSPGGNDDWDSNNWGQHSTSSAYKLSVASYFISVLFGVFLAFY